MTEFEEWYGQHIFLPESGGSIRDRLKSAFHAGQVSAIAPVGFQRSDVIALQECVDELQAKCAELERDLKMTDEFRIKALNDLATIKAQAGDPDQIDFWKNATDNAMKMISERNKTIEELTAQEPIACMVKDSKVPNDCLLYLHPTTERRVPEDAIRQLLTGIDQTETEDDLGWWETSAGAKFGAKKLAELLALLNAAPAPAPTKESK